MLTQIRLFLYVEEQSDLGPHCLLQRRSKRASRRHLVAINIRIVKSEMSQCMRFPTMWYVRPAKAQTSLHIRAVWSEPLLVAWISYECKATDWTPFEVSKPKRRLHRLVWVYTCQNTKLLKISCRGSNYFSHDSPHLTFTSLERKRII